MKIFFALFISFTYAAKFPESKEEIVEKASTSRLDQLDPDTFYYIIGFLNAEEVLNLRFLSQRVYHRVKELWPRMELSTVIEGFHSIRPVDFSHVVEIRGINMETIEGQNFFYNRAQLSCLRDFVFEGKCIHDFQAVIDLLPKDSLTSLTFENIDWTRSLISKIYFPKLTHLTLSGDIRLGHDTFDLLPNCMKVLRMVCVGMDAIRPSSLATALITMDKLEILSLQGCVLYENSLSTILENLPASLKKLDIDWANLSCLNKKCSEFAFKRLSKMTCLQEINFFGASDELTIEIISNLPRCIINIVCRINGKTIEAFQQRSNEFMNVRVISLYWVDTKLFPVVRKIFPNLDESIKKTLDN